jgi:hypothetical protein
MQLLNVHRYSLTLAAASLLAGCGGSQPLVGAPLSLNALNGPLDRSHLSSSDGDFIYVATTKALDFLTYPQGKLVGSLPFPRLSSVCADPNSGSVFVMTTPVYEYAHGGTSALEALNLPSGDSSPRGCSVDPTTDNLALIATSSQPSFHPVVLVYPQAGGAPAVYALQDSAGASYTAYDDSGNLYVLVSQVNGHYAVALLPAGQSDFQFVKVPHLAEIVGDKIQWDGTYLSMLSGFGTNQSAVIYQLQIQGTSGMVAGSTTLQDGERGAGYWVQSGSVISLYYKPKAHGNWALAAWPYPSGGSPTARYYGITKGRKDKIYDVTVSVAPAR